MSKRGKNRALLSPADNAWLRMEHPTNLMMISGVFLFEEPLQFGRVRQVLQERLLAFDRFRQRVVEPKVPFQPALWEDDPHFDIDAHLHRIALPAPGDKATLQELMNDLMSSPLDFTKPLWQMHLVEGYGSGSALICRLHHCIADGIALVRVLLSLTDTSTEVDSTTPDRGRGDTRATPSPGWTQALGSAEKLASRVVDGTRQIVTKPERLLKLALMGASGTASLARLLLLPPDPPTPIKGTLGVRKHCAWTEPLALADVKAIGRVTGGTVNDVLLSVVSGAVGRYLRYREFSTSGLNFRAVVPVNLRPPDEPLRLGNAFGLVFLPLPVGIRDPLDRLIELKKRMDELKGTPEAVVAFGILNAIGLATDEIEQLVVEMFGKKATAVMTNVPGPQEQLYFAGSAIDGIMFWVPQSGRLGLGISILSYNQEVLIGVATDAGLIPDPHALVEAVQAEFEEYMGLLRLARKADAEHSTRSDRRCAAATKSGRRCKNSAVTGSPYCHVHQAAD